MANTGANADKKLSAEGHTALAHAEAVRHAYYEDQGNNCTYGLGHLVHYGPCTAAEAASHVTDAMIDLSLSNNIADAERIVRQAVPDHPLTQAQFDAAVSFAFNVGARARKVLAHANNGDLAGVARGMVEYVNVCDHDPRTGATIQSSCHVSHGLISRRQIESAPFRNSP